MNLQFTLPLDQANVEVFFSFPLTEGGDEAPVVTLAGASPSQVLNVCLWSVVEINAQLTYCGRILLASAINSADLSTLISPVVNVEIPGVSTDSSVTVSAFVQTSNRATVPVSVTQGA